MSSGKDPQRAFAAPAHVARYPDIAFRPLVEADLPFLARLYASTREAELAPVPWPEEAKQTFLADQFARQHEHYQRHYAGADFLIIERAGEPVGRVYVYRSPGEIRLMEISLLGSHRGQGLGTALLAELIDEAERSGADLTLHVEADNPAVRLYRRLGFEHREDRGVYQFYGRRPASAR